MAALRGFPLPLKTGESTESRHALGTMPVSCTALNRSARYWKTESGSSLSVSMFSPWRSELVFLFRPKTPSRTSHGVMGASISSLGPISVGAVHFGGGAGDWHLEANSAQTSSMLTSVGGRLIVWLFEKSR